MPLKSILEIDVKDDSFQRFQAAFEAYCDGLKETVGTWGDVAHGTDTAAQATGKLAKSEKDLAAAARARDFAKGRAVGQDRAEAAARAKANETTLGWFKKLDKAADGYATRLAGTVRHWATIAGGAKQTEAHVTNVTRIMSGWKALGFFGALGGVGGALYGLDRLAAGAAYGRRQSMGTGAPFGKGRAFALDYGRFGDGDALMGAIGTAKGDATSAQYLGLRSAGISAGDIRGKDAADLGAELFDKLPGLFPRGPDDPLFGSVFSARGLDSLMAPEDAKRFLRATPDERAAQRKAYENDSRSMAADPASLRKWADLDTALGRAKDNIETAFIKGLAPLAPQFTALSGDVSKLIGDFTKSSAVKSGLDDLDSGLGAVDKALNDPNSWWNKADRAVQKAWDDVGKAGDATHKWIKDTSPALNPANIDWYHGGNAMLHHAAKRGHWFTERDKNEPDFRAHAEARLRAFDRGVGVSGNADVKAHADIAATAKATGEIRDILKAHPEWAGTGPDGWGVNSPSGGVGGSGRHAGGGPDGGGSYSPGASLSDRASSRGVPAAMTGRSTVAKGLTPEARAFLDDIASGEGDYNELNGGARFTSYAQHPQPYKGGRAAGRYQFLGSTWLGIQHETGLKDFSPESQDKGGWYLAQRDYRLHTGRDLQTDLASKDPARIAAIGRALHSTWVSTNGSFADKYLKFYARDTARPSASPVAAAMAPTPAGTPAKAVTDAEVFAARQRMLNGSRDPKDKVTVERYIRQQNAPRTAEADVTAAQHVRNLMTAHRAVEHRLFPWQRHDFKAAVQAAKGQAGVVRAQQEGRRATDARMKTSGLNLDQYHRRPMPHVTISNATGANVAQSAGPASY